MAPVDTFSRWSFHSVLGICMVKGLKNLLKMSSNMDHRKIRYFDFGYPLKKLKTIPKNLLKLINDRINHHL